MTLFAGWEIFQAIEKNCKTLYGYGSYTDVTNVDKPPKDEMESFFPAETLKYLYLLFDPDSKVDLDSYVFNTEAHPLKMFDKM
jgi:mannosyl-oligosaccharide alpha-1,2-mannosidase